EMHLTLGYFGKAEKANLNLKENLVTWAYALSMEETSIEAQVKCVARLVDDDPQAVVILVESQRIMDLRVDLDAGLLQPRPPFVPGRRSHDRLLVARVRDHDHLMSLRTDRTPGCRRAHRVPGRGCGRRASGTRRSFRRSRTE